MAILRQYACPKHGITECFDDAPHCKRPRCKEDLIELPSAPRILHQATKGIDKTARQLAADYGMTNIKTTREGEAQKGGDSSAGGGVFWGGQIGPNGKPMPTVGDAVKGGLARPIRDEGIGINRRQLGPLPGPASSTATPDAILKAVK